MLSVKGIIKNGMVEPIEGQDGQEVIITRQEDKAITTDNSFQSSWDEFLNFIDENAMETEV